MMPSEFQRKTDGGGALENLAYAGAEGARHCFAVLNLSGKRTKQLMYFTFYRNYINMFLPKPLRYSAVFYFPYNFISLFKEEFLWNSSQR